MSATHTTTYTHTTYADPYKRCRACGGWVTGAINRAGPLRVTPCGHTSGYEDVCPSWGPVDGCTCGALDHARPQLLQPGQVP